MNKEMEILMQKKVINEDEKLSKLIEDIVPLKEKKFTNLEIEASKNKEFSLVLYKKENFVLRFFKGIKFGIEKLKIIKHSNSFELEKLNNK